MPENPKLMSTEQLEQEVGELAAHIAAATCRWLLLVAELDRRRAWGEWGCKSCAEWLSYACGLAPRAAREQVRVAHRLEHLPSVRNAFGCGEISYSKARAITRVASQESEAELLGLARHATAAQLERVVRAYRGVLSTQVEEANRSHRERYLTWEWDDDGSLMIRGRLPAEDGALLVRALEAGRDQLRGSAEPHDGDTDAPSAEACTGGMADRHGPSNADALVLLAETSLTTRAAERTGGDRYQVVVHVASQVLGADAADGACELEDGPALAPETARRIACDAALVTMAERGGRPLSVGRKTRSIPPALRRALHSRDRCCRFPGCTERRFVDAHHIHHWAHGGETKLSNLLLLCRHHHRLIHEGGYSVEHNGPTSMLFRRPDGRSIAALPRSRSGHPEKLGRNAARVGSQLTAATPMALSGGDKLDYGMAVDLLLHRDGLDVSAETSSGRSQSEELACGP